jgi:hypothetical protein
MTLRTIVRHVPTGARILDVGGGPGTYLEPLARRGFDPWLCDLSDANVVVARERATALVALLTTGRFEHKGFFTDAYVTELAEFRAMLRRARCRVIDTLSAESFCAFMDVPLCEWATSDENYAKLLDLVDKTARRPEQIASAEHVLVVVRTHG